MVLQCAVYMSTSLSCEPGGWHLRGTLLQGVALCITPVVWLGAMRYGVIDTGTLNATLWLPPCCLRGPVLTNGLHIPATIVWCVVLGSRTSPACYSKSKLRQGRTAAWWRVLLTATLANPACLAESSYRVLGAALCTTLLQKQCTAT